jgi:hypothetical protein
MESGRLLGAFEALVRTLTARVDYHALYPARVVKQHADGTLDVLPEGTRLGPLSSVPIRLGIPGSRIDVSGGRVLIGFEGGDPDRPIATLWDTATGVTIHINGGGTHVAKVGSSVTGTAGPFGVVAAVQDGSATVQVP